jgi:hypothetical protein
MNRTENDLRSAMRELEQRADEHGAPSTASILSAATGDRVRGRRTWVSRHSRWLLPLAAAAAVAAVVTTIALSGGSGDSPRPHGAAQSHSPAPSGEPTSAHTAIQRTTPPSHRPSAPSSTSAAAEILDAGASKLDATGTWTTPSPHDFFYVRTTDATTWTSVSGRRPGDGRNADGVKIAVPGCKNGQIVAHGESGPCTLNDVPHYLADAPMTPSAWDGYLEQIAPGAKGADAQGKIIIEVLHQDLVAPKAAAALLRYTATCPGLHTLTVRSVQGRELIGVTCASMTNGSYGLAFEKTTHALVGYVSVTSSGQQTGPAEIVIKTGIVPAIGRTP